MCRGIFRIKAGNTPAYNSYPGGDDHGEGIAVVGAGHVYVARYTYSTNFPTTDATGATTTSAYDPLGRQTSTTNPVSGTATTCKIAH